MHAHICTHARTHTHTHTHTLQYYPTSLQMFELMCWCWSDKPQHRPNVKEIIEILSTDTFTQLLSSSPVTQNNIEVTAACLRVTAVPRRRSSVISIGRRSTSGSIGDISAPYSCLFGHSALGEETCATIWYGTEDGTLSMVQYQPNGTDTEVLLDTV